MLNVGAAADAGSRGSQMRRLLLAAAGCAGRGWLLLTRGGR
jgi:hypothetical protein